MSFGALLAARAMGGMFEGVEAFEWSPYVASSVLLLGQRIAQRPEFHAPRMLFEILRISGHPQALGHARCQQSVFARRQGLDIGAWRHQVGGPDDPVQIVHGDR